MIFHNWKLKLHELTRHVGSIQLNDISGYGTNVVDVLVQVGEPIRLCSTKYPIIGEPPSVLGRSHLINIISVISSGIRTCIGLPGREGGSKNQIHSKNP